jgi:hypothetical protein
MSRHTTRVRRPVAVDLRDLLRGKSIPDGVFAFDSLGRLIDGLNDGQLPCVNSLTHCEHCPIPKGPIDECGSRIYCSPELRMFVVPVVVHGRVVGYLARIEA